MDLPKAYRLYLESSLIWKSDYTVLFQNLLPVSSNVLRGGFNFGDRRAEVFKLCTQTGDLEREDRAARGEWAAWKGLRAEMEDHSADTGVAVSDRKVPQ